ncbi:hypothetical protein ACIBQ1_52630 [Nonomuraea sp. NPDC050153]|uniref:hypothetical protein n=1 Tax=Nonomuraea sp. NPDC050153 TaxID=3364359 RepID=UPI0037BB270C
MEDLFTQVLVLAARAGLGRLGLVAVDGTKIAANASKDASRTEAGLRKLAREMLANAEEADTAEDELFGPDRRGDRVPAELADPVTRKDRIRSALKELEDQRRAAEAEQEAKIAKFMEGQAAGVSQGGVPVGAELAVVQASLDKAIARQQAKIDNYKQRRAAAVAAGHIGPPGPPPKPVEEFGLVLEVVKGASRHFDLWRLSDLAGGGAEVNRGPALGGVTVARLWLLSRNWATGP